MFPFEPLHVGFNYVNVVIAAWLNAPVEVKFEVKYN